MIKLINNKIKINTPFSFRYDIHLNKNGYMFYCLLKNSSNYMLTVSRDRQFFINVCFVYVRHPATTA